MLDIGSPELLLIAIVAIVVIGPKDLPKAMRVVGYWVGKARGTMRQFRAGFDAMVREAELAEIVDQDDGLFRRIGFGQQALEEGGLASAQEADDDFRDERLGRAARFEARAPQRDRGHR